MSIYYRMDDLQDNMNPEGKKKTGLYPRIMNNRTVFLDELAEQAAQHTTISKFEARLVADMLIEQTIKELRNGNSVCFNDFGTFSLTAKSRREQDESKIRSASIEVSRLTFRMSRAFLRRLGVVDFVRLPKKK
ncbi:MAG: HU family DNA-binding protein [Bacteroidales bacterium]|jgi:predicted histone-like DNA-binding protein|nr:HU family DNA-binding protein [Bacteroidales bacterium]